MIKKGRKLGLVIWTHYFDQHRVMDFPALARHFRAAPEQIEFRGTPFTPFTLHQRHYLEALDWPGFCGGQQLSAKWMERDDILHCLSQRGFTDIDITHDNPDHPNGPSVLVLPDDTRSRLQRGETGDAFLPYPTTVTAVQPSSTFTPGPVLMP